MSDSSKSNDPASIWDRRYGEGKLACTQEVVRADPIDYTQHPFLYKHSVAKRLTGDREASPLLVHAEQYLRPPAKRMLAVGSGLAFAEELLVRNGYVESVVAFESSCVAVESAQKRIAAAGLQDKIEIRCGDVINAGLVKGTFDAVFVQAAIHHFFNIEEMFELFYRVLMPNGLILYDEYVGPDHHMYEAEVMELMDEVDDCLAPAYRWDVLRGATREEVPRATLEWMLQMDPSEGVHSSRILPLTYKYFDVVSRRDYGGTFMRPFFVGILPNFDFDDPKDQTVGRLVILIEELLIRYGVIPSYHTRVIGRRRDTPREDMSEAEASRINYANWDGLRKHGAATHVKQIAEYTAVNHCDENWKNGVGLFGGAVLLLVASRRARRDFVVGRTIVLPNNTKRAITDVRENDGSLIVTLAGGGLDPDIAGYPNVIRFCDIGR